MPKAEARGIVEKNWKIWDNSNNFFTTAYQLAAQMGLYYEDDEIMHVKFTKDISIDDSAEYLQAWARRYYVPNPYTKSIAKDDIYSERPIIINNFLVNWALDNPNGKWEDAIKVLFPNGIGNDDILKNMLNNFSEVKITNGIIQVKGKTSKYENIFVNVVPDDKMAFFNHFNAYPKNNRSGKVIAFDYQLNSFILKCVKELSNIDNLNSLIPYISSPIIEGKPIKIASDEDGFSLTGMFLETNEEDRVARNETIPRWFPDIFTLDGHQVYLSTQWNGKGDYQLTKADFVKMLEVCYPNRFSCIVDEVPHTLRLYSEPLQTIYYGSPGTGKSHIVEHKVLDGVPEHFQFRTTFHPDTDYASFVGCYKPVSKEVKPEIHDLAKLQEVYDQEYKVMIKEKDKEKDKEKEKDSKNKTEVIAKFIQDYAESIVEAAKESSLNQVIKSLYDTGNDTYFAEMTKLVLEERKRCNCQIVYEFVPQVFTDAYIAAWQNLNQQVYLVIEEINRGNCAQIFGDLFQLLDRKNGVSQYKVKAEKDLANYLMGMLDGDAKGGILDGKLSLPANLNIVATMNTSDQSLFPMDSAFKRRWDWKYIPTTPPTDKNKVIEIGDRKYDWKKFLNQINERIQEATRSEDKKLGFWFVKTQEGKDIISDNTFASKVIFYLWNDVFKDLGDKGNPFVCEVGGKTALTSFNSFFMMNSDGDVVVNVDAIHKFMANLGLNPIE